MTATDIEAAPVPTLKPPWTVMDWLTESIELLLLELALKGAVAMTLPAVFFRTRRPEMYDGTS
ncbi:hypothetical protein D3C76_1607460 [compost metagenome]